MAKELQKPSCETRDKNTEDDYIDMLRECYGTINVCGMAMDAANILKECDPIAFRVGFNEWNESIDVYICPICGTEFEEDEDGALHCCQTEDEPEDITEDLENFDLENLDELEQVYYTHHTEKAKMSKVDALQVIINTVEGDYTQLSAELAELAEKQKPTEY